MKTKKTLQSGAKLSLVCASLVLASGMTSCSKNQTEIPGPQAPTNIETKGNNGNIGMPGLPGGDYAPGSMPLITEGAAWKYFRVGDMSNMITFRVVWPLGYKSISVDIWEKGTDKHTSITGSFNDFAGFPGTPVVGPFITTTWHNSVERGVRISVHQLKYDDRIGIQFFLNK